MWKDSVHRHIHTYVGTPTEGAPYITQWVSHVCTAGAAHLNCQFQLPTVLSTCGYYSDCLESESPVASLFHCTHCECRTHSPMCVCVCVCVCVSVCVCVCVCV